MDGGGAPLSPPLRALLVAVPLTFLGVFFVYPIASILALGLAPDGRLDLSALARVLADHGLREVAWFTLWQAALSTALTFLAALPAAYVMARYEFPGKRVLRAAATIPFVLPTVVVGAAFLALLGPRSPINTILMSAFDLAQPPLDLRHTIWAILLAHVFYNFAIVLRIVGGLWSHLDPRLEEAARMLGAGRWTAFRTVTWPLLRPAVAAAAAIVFLFTFSSFGVILILGGPTFATLEVEIYRQTAQLLNLPVAASLSVIQLAAVSTLLLVYGRLQERASLEQRLVPVREAARRPQGRAAWTLVGGTMALMAIALGLPLAVLVERSLAVAGGYGADHYLGLAEPARGVLSGSALEALRNSLLFAAAATLIALGVGMMASTVIAGRRGRTGRSFDALLALPLGTSAVTVGFGFIVALDGPPLDLRTSPLLIPIAHALVAIPFVIRSVVPVLRSIDRRMREAAIMLGASPARVWREVDLPIVARAALVGAGFAFAISLGEFGATIFIARPDVTTLPVAIFRLLGQPGAATFGQAMAMSTVLMLVTAGAVLAIERVRIDTGSAF
ncbi:iron ABC transporter permease [soil metagenome]